jgi:hypothetical protein
VVYMGMYSYYSCVFENVPDPIHYDYCDKKDG